MTDLDLMLRLMEVDDETLSNLDRSAEIAYAHSRQVMEKVRQEKAYRRHGVRPGDRIRRVRGKNAQLLVVSRTDGLWIWAKPVLSSGKHGREVRVMQFRREPVDELVGSMACERKTA